MMESLMEVIDLDVDEASELLFRVRVEGADPAPAKVRLVCEEGDMALMFNGYSVGNDLVQFNLPVLRDRMKEGVYDARVEVLIENRYFSPVKFQINFRRTMSVVAEAVSHDTTKSPMARVNVSAAPVAMMKKFSPVVTQAPPPVPVQAPPQAPIEVQSIAAAAAAPPPVPATNPIPVIQEVTTKKVEEQSSLRDRYASKKITKKNAVDLDEEQILEAAQRFLKTHKKKR